MASMWTTSPRPLRKVLRMAESTDLHAARHTGSLITSVRVCARSSFDEIPSPPSPEVQQPSTTAPEPGASVTTGGAEVTQTRPPGDVGGQNGTAPVGKHIPEDRDPRTPELTPAANPAAEFVERMVSRGVSLGLRGNRLFLSPSSAYAELSYDMRSVLRTHRAEIKELIRTAGPFVISPTRDTAAPAPQPQPEPARSTQRSEVEPVVFVGRKRVTESDVRGFMADLGDEELADYEAGRISKIDAYESTRLAMLQRLELRGW